jgi:hypothetical protein
MVDMNRAAEEISQRLELRGVERSRVFTDPSAASEFWDVVGDVTEDMLAQEIIYGSMSNGGEFTGLLNLPGIEIDGAEPGFRRLYLGDWHTPGEPE